MSLLKEHLVGMTHGDLRTYFNGSFLKILTPKSDEFQYYRVEEIEGEGRACKFYLSGEPPKETVKAAGAQAFALKDLHFDFGFPERGFYSCNGEAIIYSQAPVRHSCKGMSRHGHFMNHILAESRCDFYNPFGSSLPNMPTNFLKSAHLNQLFIKKDSLPVEAKISKVLKQKQLSAPFSRNFALSIGIESSFPSIWFRNNCVGELVSDKRVLIKNLLFYQEAVDFFTQHNITVDRA